MHIIENVRHVAGKAGEKISGIFEKTGLANLARKTGFIQRSTSKIQGEDFVRLMTTEILGDETVTTEGLCDILRQINPEADITPQAMSERLNNKESAEYLKEVFESALRENLEPLRSDVSHTLLSGFDRVFLEDSTQIALHEKLADKFRGSGGKASISAIKIDLTYEVRQDILCKILISEGNIPDQSRAEEILGEIGENDLILGDMGYFTLNSLSRIGEKNAFFLSRLPKSVGVYLSADDDAASVNLPKYLDKKFSSLTVTDTDVWLGEKKVPCRLVAYRLPDEVVGERREKARRNARKKGRQPTQEHLDWLGYGFFITNVPQEIWEPEVTGTAYRLRWQIELTFRHWKSLMKINIVKGSHPERVECFLCGRLTAVLIAEMFCGYASWYAYKYLKKEAGFYKLISWLKRKDRLAKAADTGSLTELFDEMREIMSKSLCKQKRKRKTTHQLLDEGIPYMDSFLPEESENGDNSLIPFKKAAQCSLKNKITFLRACYCSKS